jgi:hypothetical protein
MTGRRCRERRPSPGWCSCAEVSGGGEHAVDLVRPNDETILDCELAALYRRLGLRVAVHATEELLDLGLDVCEFCFILPRWRLGIFSHGLEGKASRRRGRSLT